MIKKIKESLLRLPRFIKRGIVILVDILLCVFTTWLAFAVSSDQLAPLSYNQIFVSTLSTCIAVPLFLYFGLYHAIFRYIGSNAFDSIARAFIIYASLFICVFSLLGIQNISRAIGIIQPFFLFVGVGISRYVIKRWLGGINSTHSGDKRNLTIALIYGAGAAGRQLASTLVFGKKIIVRGFIDDNKELSGNLIDGIKVYHSENLPEIIKVLNVTEVLLAIPSADQISRNNIILRLGDCNVKVRTLPNLLDIASGFVSIQNLNELDMNDLLGREVVPPNIELMKKNIYDKVVVVTGAGGSIGSELCRQIFKFSPKLLVLIDNSESSLYCIYEELKKVYASKIYGAANGQIHISSGLFSVQPKQPIKILARLASVRDRDVLFKIFSECKPDTVFHAAAYKHVPLVEENPIEGIYNNVFGTLTCAEVSAECLVSHFILISTDKAVRPSSVMGASKRIAELILQAKADDRENQGRGTIFSMVRFGNVLGSSGSVAPIFSSQIKSGGPITLTHTEVTRYFMTIPEAAQLVIQASAMAAGGEVFVLEMGPPIKIYDLALRMIRLSGLTLKDRLNPNGDIEIEVIGLRPGEKLHEDLLIGSNPQPTSHPKIMKAHENFVMWCELIKVIQSLEQALQGNDIKLVGESLKNLMPENSLLI